MSSDCTGRQDQGIPTTNISRRSIAIFIVHVQGLSTFINMYKGYLTCT